MATKSFSTESIVWYSIPVFDRQVMAVKLQSSQMRSDDLPHNGTPNKQKGARGNYRTNLTQRQLCRPQRASLELPPWVLRRPRNKKISLFSVPTLFWMLSRAR